ncbi:MAG: hypothetical protein Q9178_007060 [Gyalolechia marmorata]
MAAATSSGSTQFTSSSSSSPGLKHGFAVHEVGPSDQAMNVTCFSSSPKDSRVPVSVQPTCLQTGNLPEWTEEMEKDITRPYEYLASQPGKDIRKQLLAACNSWLQIDETALGTIGKSISMLHNASLLYVDHI